MDKEELVADVVKNSQTGGPSADLAGFKCDFSTGGPHPAVSLPSGTSFTYVPKAVTVRVGQRVDLLPLLDGSQPRVFAAAPELPPGLTIDRFTGVISGVPQAATQVSSVHFITCCEPLISFNVQMAVVNIQVQPGGIAPVTACIPNPQSTGDANPNLQVQLQQLQQVLGALSGAVTGLATEREMQQEQHQQSCQ
jgi:hypothetical protein